MGFLAWLVLVALIMLPFSWLSARWRLHEGVLVVSALLMIVDVYALFDGLSSLPPERAGIVSLASMVSYKPLLVLLPLSPFIASIAIAQAMLRLRSSSSIAFSIAFCCSTFAGFLLPVVFSLIQWNLCAQCG